MKCLALDTTTDVCSIAVADESGVLAQYDFAHKMNLSRRLMPNIVSLLKDCRLDMKDVEAIAVSLGPGSFTGLRIGVATAKTLAQVLDVPIAGVVSLDLLAQQFDYLADAVVCPLVKVRRGEVYYALFRVNRGSVERISQCEAGPIEHVIELLRRQPAVSRQETPCGPPSQGGQPGTPSPPAGEGRGEGVNPQSAIRNPQSAIVFCGDALEEHLPLLRDALGDRAIESPPWLSYPKASILAQLALRKIAEGEAADPLSLVPFYIRRSAAEMRMEEAAR